MPAPPNQQSSGPQANTVALACPLPLPQVLLMFEYLHAQDIVYRDLKVGRRAGGRVTILPSMPGRPAAQPLTSRATSQLTPHLRPSPSSPRTCCWMSGATLS